MSLNEPPAKRQRGETDRDENFIYILDEEDTPEDEKSSTCMESWLDEISLPHLAELFDSAEIDMSLVAHLSAEDLIELGIDSAHERQLILEHAKRKLEGCKTSGHRHPSSAVMAVVGKLAEIPKLPANRDRGKITSFFFPINGQVSTSLVDMRPIGVRFDPSSLNHDPAPGGTLDSGLASTSAASSSSNASLLARARSSPLPHDTTLSKNIPRWKKLPGTRMTVDCFAEISKDLKGCPYWVLSHFHSDHYRGLGKKFNQGIIICTEVTGRLIEQRLKIPKSIILTLPFNVPMMIEGSTIELIDANHCPGAAMILCETPAKVTVLHCGDCRLARHHQSHPSLVRTRGTAMLILDTTYCDPQYNFPPQSETIDFVFQEIKREAFNPRCLILFGSYTIGKERLVLEVARRLEKKVYVSKDKMSILECCDIPSEYRSLLTTDHLSAQIHLVAMFKISKQGIESILSHCQGRYTSAIGISPTGWTHQKEKVPGSKSMGSRVKCKGPISILKVPYSEHSSFDELVEFCRWYQPLEIVPSVNGDFNGPKTKKMVDWLKNAISR